MRTWKYRGPNAEETGTEYGRNMGKTWKKHGQSMEERGIKGVRNMDRSNMYRI